jgi:transcriptional/translational regulatory protein YebC/TACO1
VRIPQTFVDLTPEQEEELHILIEKIEVDEDVQQVFANIR